MGALRLADTGDIEPNIQGAQAAQLRSAIRGELVLPWRPFLCPSAKGLERNG